MWTTWKNYLLGKQILSCSFCLYRFLKYLSYGSPIINFCNPGADYEKHCKKAADRFGWNGLNANQTSLILYELVAERLRIQRREQSWSSHLLMPVAASKMQASNSSCASTFLLSPSLHIETHSQKSNSNGIAVRASSNSCISVSNQNYTRVHTNLFFSTITDTITSQSTDLSTWTTL